MDENKLEEYRKIVQKILEAFHRVPFPIIIESTTNTTAEPINLSDKKDESLVEEISKLADKVALKFNRENISKDSYERIKGNIPKSFRPNEVSIVLEHELTYTFDEYMDEFEVIKQVEHLSQSGYPDVKIVDIYERITFLEIKATTRPDLGSPRDFYFTPLKNTKRKINQNGRHLLLGFIIEEVEPKIYRTIGWKLVDLTKIRVSMKPEFNANNKEIYKRDAVIRERWVDER